MASNECDERSDHEVHTVRRISKVRAKIQFKESKDNFNDKIKKPLKDENTCHMCEQKSHSKFPLKVHMATKHNIQPQRQTSNHSSFSCRPRTTERVKPSLVEGYHPSNF